MIRAQPMDAVVLVGGCDKTVPAQLMGAISANRPAINLVAGPMMTSRWHGERLGACTDCRRFWAKYRAGEVDDDEIHEIEGNLATTAGTCAVMGTASTMASIAVEALGMITPAARRRSTRSMPTSCAPPRRPAAPRMRLAAEKVTPDKIKLTPKSVENALRVLMAIGGSTNAVLHLTAVAGRAGIDIGLDRLNELSDSTPVIVDLKPTGPHYMEDLFAAGGIGAVLRELQPMLHLDCLTVAGETIGERLARPAGPVDREVVKPLAEPLQESGGLVALFGSLAPKGAIFKRSAADPKLFEKEGRAVVTSPRSKTSPARIGQPRPRRDAGRFPRPAKCRAAVAVGEARGRLSADPAKARPRRRQGHGPHLRRAHERHRLWLDCPSCDPGRAFPGGPLAKVRDGDRIRLTLGEKPPHRSPCFGRRARRAAPPRSRRSRRAATPSSTVAKSSRPTEAATSTSCAKSRWPSARALRSRARPQEISSITGGQPSSVCPAIGTDKDIAMLRTLARSAMSARRLRLAAAVCALSALLPSASASAATQDDKGLMGLMYVVQMAPRVCQWSDAGPTTNIDPKVKEAEGVAKLSEAETADIKAKAEAELRKDPSNCAKDGMVRSMYDDSVTGK